MITIIIATIAAIAIIFYAIHSIKEMEKEKAYSKQVLAPLKDPLIPLTADQIEQSLDSIGEKLPTIRKRKKYEIDSNINFPRTDSNGRPKETLDSSSGFPFES